MKSTKILKVKNKVFLNIEKAYTLGREAFEDMQGVAANPFQNKKMAKSFYDGWKFQQNLNKSK